MHSQITPLAESTDKAGGRRILAIDATRGLVMQFSCLAHFAWWIHPAYPAASERLAAMGMVATPTFVLVSGAMVALLSATSRGGLLTLSSQLFNRGFFLVTVGHLLITLAEAHQSGSFMQTFAGASTVDEIGLCTLLAALVIRHIADPAFCRRLAWAAIPFLLAIWLLVLVWHPGGMAETAVKQIFIGGDVGPRRLSVYTSPTLQYMALYVLGFPIGHALAAYMTEGESRARMSLWFWRAGLSLVATACVLRAAYILVEPHHALSGAVDFTLRATVKSPPSPVYLAFFAGFGLTFAGALFWLHEHGSRAGEALLRWLATIGRSSLFVFILQYFLYWTLPDLLRIHPGPTSPLVFVANVLLIWVAARIWGQIGGNRWMKFNFRLPGGRTPLPATTPS